MYFFFDLALKVEKSQLEKAKKSMCNFFADMKFSIIV